VEKYDAAGAAPHIPFVTLALNDSHALNLAADKVTVEFPICRGTKNYELQSNELPHK
jgi:hypothetical protein